MHKLAAIVLALTFTAQLADAKPRTKSSRRKTDAAEVAVCVHERTGPTGGIPADEALKLCRSIARTKAKVERAIERASKAIEACEQAIADACVEGAKDDGSTSCEDEALKPSFAVCH